MNSLFFQYPLKRTPQKRVTVFPGWNEINSNIQWFSRKKWQYYAGGQNCRWKFVNIWFQIKNLQSLNANCETHVCYTLTKINVVLGFFQVHIQLLEKPIPALLSSPLHVYLKFSQMDVSKALNGFSDHLQTVKQK